MDMNEINLDSIDIKAIENSIDKRNTRIMKEKEGYLHCLDITDTLKFYVDDDFKEDARLISRRIKKLKLQNMHAALFVKTVRSIAVKRSIPLDMGGHIADKPEKLNLSSIEGVARNHIGVNEYALKHRQYKGLDDLTPEIEAKLKAEIKQCNQIIQNVAGARTEIMALKEKLLSEEKANNGDFSEAPKP